MYGGAQRAPLVNGQPSNAVFGMLWQDHGTCVVLSETYTMYIMEKDVHCGKYVHCEKYIVISKYLQMHCLLIFVNLLTVAACPYTHTAACTCTYAHRVCCKAHDGIYPCGISLWTILPVVMKLVCRICVCPPGFVCTCVDQLVMVVHPHGATATHGSSPW